MGDSASAKPILDTQLFRDAFNASPIGIAVENLDGQPLFVNPAFCRFLGFTEEELRRKHCVDFSPKEDAEKDWTLFQQLRAGSIDHYQLEKRYFRRDGSLVWGSLSISLLNSHPSPLVIAMVEDITDKKTAEDAVRESEERLRLAQQAARIGTFEWNIRTGVNTWTPELEAMYGLPRGGFGGTQTAFENLVHPNDRAAVVELVDDAFKTGRPTNGEWRVIWTDGSVHWIAGRWQVFMNESGEPSRMIGVNMDITERKMAEEALCISEQRYRLLFEKNVAGVGIASSDGRVLDCNDGWAHILGYQSREEIRGRLTSEFYFDPADRQSLLDELSEKHVLLSRRLQVKRKDGSPVWVLLNGAELNVGKNTTLRQATMIDISQWQRAEEALSGMTRKLIESQEQERRRIGRELHDDINQRLAMLAIELEQLESDPSDVQSRVQELRKQMGELSNDVQALSHELHSSKLEYLGVVSGIKSWCKEFGERQKMEIDFKSDVSSVLPFDIGIGLFRVLQESLHNAVKHSGVKRIEVELREASNEIHLIVSDLGRGFDVEAALQGKGLGLTSMRERVRLVNGTISIESKPMGGTTIHVRVPCSA